MATRKIGRYVGVGAILAVAGLVTFIVVRIATGPPIYDPEDSSMSDLRLSLIPIPGVVDVGLRYPTVDNVAGGAMLLEMGDADPDTVRAAIVEATCRVWLQMYLDPSFIWTAVVRDPTDVVSSGSPFDPYGIADPVDLGSLVTELEAERFEDGYLQWTPAVLEQRCGPRADDP